jgi:nitroreductase
VKDVDALKAIMSRRSIRKYSEAPVTDDQLRTIVAAGMQAPSAHNRQPWHFIVIRDRATLNGIMGFHLYSRMLDQAKAAIVVCGDHVLEEGSGFWVQDCSAATENILLAAHASGLGAVWLGVYPQKDLVEPLKQLLNIPSGVTPLGIISVGVSAEVKEPRQNYIESRVHQDRW